MPTKQDIIDAIKETAEENNGKPLGRDRFEKETGISSWEIGKHWARFSDAQKEAGYSPNKLNPAHDVEFLLESITKLSREVSHFPTRGEMRLKRSRNSDFPSDSVFYRRFGGKSKMARKVSDYAKKKGYRDVVQMCSPLIKRAKKIDESTTNANYLLGEVYLFKSGRYYKIGKTNDTVRRGQELKVQLPERLHLIHSIKTDDPSGVEAYWHRRFESKRMQGEWFDLNADDIKAFKRWRRIA